MKTQIEEPVIFISLESNEDPKALISEKYPKNITIPTIARIYDPLKEKERIVQYTKGAKTIYKDEMPEEGVKTEPSKEPIIMVDGLLRLNPREKILIEYLEKTFIQGNANLMEGQPIYYKRDTAKTAKENLEKVYEDVELIAKIRNMSAEELCALSMVKGDLAADRKEADENRWNLIVAAKNDPKSLWDKIKSVSTSRKGTIMLAVNQGIIEIDKKARQIKWDDGGLILEVPIGCEPVDYFVEMTSQEQYKAVLGLIIQRIEGVIPEKKVKQNPEPKTTESEEEQLFEKALSAGLLGRKGVHWSFPKDAQIGDKYRSFVKGGEEFVIEYIKNNPDLKAKIEAKLKEVEVTV